MNTLSEEADKQHTHKPNQLSDCMDCAFTPYQDTPSDLPSGDVEQIVYKLYNRAFLANEPDTKDQAEAITALQALQDKKVAEALKNYAAEHILEQLTNKSKGGK